MIYQSESQQEAEPNSNDSRNFHEETIQELWAQLREPKLEVEVARGEQQEEVMTMLA